MANRTGTSKNDKLTGTAASDRLFGLEGNDLLIGLGGVDTLNGGAGNDTLDGGTGNDKLIGGAGNDTYIVDATSGTDIYSEVSKNGGTDTIRSSRASFTLGNPSATANHIENLTLFGPAVTGIGNSLNNVITGSSLANTLSGMAGNDTLNGGVGNDSLNGGVGADSMAGGAGNDTYVVDVAGDKVFESGSGTDTVQSTVTFSLAAHAQIENLTLQGGGHINGTGNALANTLIGNTGNNTLSGLDGNDKLDGGNGNDILDGGAGNDSLVGGIGSDSLAGGTDKDTLDGGTGVDTLLGGAGIDVLIWDAADAMIDGGTETDILRVTANGAVNLLPENVIGIEIVNLAAANTLTLDAAKIEAMTVIGVLTVDGGAGDAVIAGSGWMQLANDAGYAVYEQGLAMLRVDLDINRDGIGVEALTMATLDGTNGFRLDGVNAGDQSGISVSGAGDVNGDGFADIVIGAYRADPGATDAGVSYVVFGGTAFSSSLSLSALDGTNGFRLEGVGQDDWSGFSVASAGDVNGDGLADLVIGAPNGNDVSGMVDINHGESYVVFGGTSFSPSLSLSGLNGSDGFTLKGVAHQDSSGFSVSSAGDVNGDGYDDLIVGAFTGDDSGNIGKTYVVFGGTGGYLDTLHGSTGFSLAGLDGTNGFRLEGIAPGDHSGVSVSSAGDVNNDGFDDVVVGAHAANGSTGETYVVFGNSSFASSLALSALDGANGFRLDGIDASDFSGISVSAAGDVNGDGFGDVIVGARPGIADLYSPGESYVVFGGSGFESAIALSALDGSNGFRLDGIDATDHSGRSVASAGDVNGDGYDDLIVGAYRGDAGATDSGESYIVFGGAGFASALSLAALDGANGFRLDGINADDLSGRSVSSAGDVDGDGFDDVLVSAQRGDAGAADAGETYVIFGRDFTGAVDLAGGAGTDSLEGGLAAEVFVGGRGNDTMTGGGGSDVFRGGAGNDRILVADSGFADVDGGAGTDTLAFAAGVPEIDLADFGARLAGIEAVDLSATGAHTLAVDPLSILNLSDTSNALRVDGSGADAVNAGSGWIFMGSTATHAGYFKGGATLEVDLDVNRDGIGVIGTSLGALDGTIGFRLDGVDEDDNAGRSVAGAGDVNDDGYADLIVSAPGADPAGGENAGEVYVVFGGASGFVPALDLSTLDGTRGFRLDGVAEDDAAARSVASAGDFNGDGVADLVLGVDGADAGGDSLSGSTYVIFGRTSGFGSALELSALDGTNGFRLDGLDVNDRSGYSAASAGDLNGDGYDDLVIGARWGDPDGGTYNGETYVVFGRAAGFGSVLDLAALDGDNGFRIDGSYNFDQSGRAVASAGDMNGDGLDDLAIGAYFSDAGGTDSGAAYVLFGAAGFAASVDLSSLHGNNGFRLDGNAGDKSGRSVASAGDVNGDGYADLVIGASDAANDAGATYVVFGDADFSSELDLSALDGTNGFRLDGIFPYDGSGDSVASAGDVNGDGYDDIVIGAPAADGGAYDAGEVYVIYGSGSGFAPAIDLGSLDAGSGFRLFGIADYDGAGRSVASGDVNGDGFSDLIIGADGASDDAGAAFVFYGRDFTGAVDVAGGDGADSLEGGLAAEVFVGGRGNDTMTGGGGADVFRGGAGDDHILVVDSDFADVDGGSGSDTLAIAGGVSLNLGDLAGMAITGIEAVDLGAAGANSLTLERVDVLRLSDTSNTLRVTGGGDDVLNAGSGWSFDQFIEDGAYIRFTQGAAVLEVSSAMHHGLDFAIPLAGLDGVNGFRLDGIDAQDRSGYSVAPAGDFDGDGFADLVIGARSDSSAPGEAYVVFGATSFESSVGLAALDGSIGFRLAGAVNGDYTGFSVASAGDVNGDGLADLIIGARNADGGGDNYAGMTYVVFGRTSFASSVDLGALDGTDGFRLEGIDASDNSGTAVASAGDLDGDGLSDLLIGAPYAAGLLGETYVVFGRTSFSSSLDLGSLDGTTGFRLDGATANDRSGVSVASAGDVDGDGTADLLIGTRLGGASDQGMTYVVFGGQGFGSSLALGGLDGTTGFRLEGVAGSDYSGRSVASAGDVNGDGRADLIIGAMGADPGGDLKAGSAYVVFGATSFASSVELGSLDGTTGFRLDGVEPSDYAGWSVSSAGDVNGDGLADILVSAPFTPDGVTYSGTTYVVFGKASGFQSIFDLGALEGTDGFRLEGIHPQDRAGISAASAGDLNGDGFDDIVIGAPFVSDTGGFVGETYVVYGRDFNNVVDFEGTDGNDNVSGNSDIAIILGGLGNDGIVSGGGADVLKGGAGDDIFHIDSDNLARIFGGSGTDTLHVFELGQVLDLTGLADTLFTGIEAVSLTGSQGNVLTLSLSDLLALSDTSNRLTVDGDLDIDGVDMTDGLWDLAPEPDDDGYEVYRLGAATLRVHPNVDASGIELYVP